MKQITTNQYEALVKSIYESLINNPDFGLGEMGDCKTEAERIVDEWMEENDIELLEAAPAPAAPEPEFKTGQKVYLKSDTNISQVVDNDPKKFEELWQAAPIRREEGKSLHETSSYTLVNLDNVRLQEEFETGSNQYAKAIGDNFLLQEENKELKELLKKAHDTLHEISAIYQRDKEGFLKDNAKGWDAELDIEIEALLNKR